MIKRSCLCVALVLALAGTSPVLAQSEARHAIELQAQDLGTALKLLALQTKLQIVYPADLVQGKQAPALDGSLTATQALSQLLRGSGLKYEFLDSQTVTLSPVAGPTSERSEEEERVSTLGRNAAEMEKRTTATLPVADRLDGQSVTRKNGQAQELEKIVVTGTRIRGGTTPSPVITIGSERIQEEGFADLGEVIRSVPQNFSGGQNPGVINGSDSTNSNQNITGGSGLNLRGLGPDATLTLLNGRRLSYGGPYQAVDISAIPVEAVDRLEIVPDGASAIYGSDAVGGVGNVILKRDYEGVTVGARYGRATDGGLNTREYAATAGTTWLTGGLIATWKKTSSDPIYAEQRDYARDMDDPSTLYSGNGLRSGLFSAHQSIGDVVELRLDALRTKRDSDYYYGYPGFYVLSSTETAASLVSPSIEFSLPNDWTLTVGGAWGEDKAVSSSSTVSAAGMSTDAALFGNESRTYEVGAEGPVFTLPGGNARLAVGAGHRYNEFQQRNLTSGTTSADSDDGSRFAYAEFSLPFISPNSNITGAHRLVVSAAGRSEDYNSFGRVTTPKLGLIYGPSADFSLKASWGKSFKAPTLLQRYGTYYVYLYPASLLGGAGYASDATVLMPFGGNPDLKPERARTWSGSLVFHPEGLRGLQAELTWFDIDYTDRVLLPIAGASEALSNPIYDQFVSYFPTVEVQTDILLTSTFSNWSGAAYDPDNVVAIASNRYINVARQQIRGLDLSGSYRLDVDYGRLTARGSVSWLKSTQQTTAAQGVHDLAGTLFNPPELNSRLGVVWTAGGITTSAFVNYASGVTNTTDDRKTASFTTFDTALRYETGARNDALSGLAFELLAQNLFDQPPPLFTPTSATAVPYDSTNYSAIGRFLSFRISKQW